MNVTVKSHHINTKIINPNPNTTTILYLQVLPQLNTDRGIYVVPTVLQEGMILIQMASTTISEMSGN